MADAPASIISPQELNTVYEQLKTTLAASSVDINNQPLTLTVPVNGQPQVLTLSKDHLTLGSQNYKYEISAGLSIDFNGLEWQTDHAVAKVAAGIGFFKAPLELNLPGTISDSVWNRISPVLDKVQRGENPIEETAGSYKGVPITIKLLKE
ncbi:MAG: hypothetical protein ACK4NC_07150 [Candidatus Gracilibacteria bacterium]